MQLSLSSLENHDNLVSPQANPIAKEATLHFCGERLFAEDTYKLQHMSTQYGGKLGKKAEHPQEHPIK